MQELRREKIKAYLRDYKSAMVSDLAANLNVSEMTVHRDLDILQDDGFLIKKRGGAILNESADLEEVSNYSYSQVQNLYIEEKKAIAQEAIRMISDRETLVFDNSTTAFEVAKLVKNLNQLTVVATNPGVFDELMNANNLTLYSTGGLYSSQTNSFVGSAAEEFVSKLNISTCIIGAMGVSLEHGITDPFPSEASLKRKIIAASEKVILVVDHMKFNRVSMEKVADLEKIDVIITDWNVDEAIIAELKKKTKIIVCKREDNI